MKDKPWERLRFVTIDQLVTGVKLSGNSATSVFGNTTPEGYPFALLLAVGSTHDNLKGIEIIKSACALMSNLASGTKQAAAPGASQCPGCGFASFSPEDIRDGRCVNCEHWPRPW